MKKFDWKPKKGSFKKIQESYFKREVLQEEATPEQTALAKKYGFDVNDADEIDVKYVKGMHKAFTRKKFDPALIKIAKQVSNIVKKNGGFDNFADAKNVIDKAVKLGNPWDVRSTFTYGYGKGMGWALGNGDLSYGFPEEDWQIRDLATSQDLGVNLKTGKISGPNAIFGGRYYKAANPEEDDTEGAGFYM